MAENSDIVKPEIPVQPLGTFEPEKSEHAQLISIEYSGPIPTPGQMSAYEALLPGATDRFISMAEEMLKHKHKMETEQLNLDKEDVAQGWKLSFLGVRSARLLGITSIICSTFLIYTGNVATGSILGGATIAYLVYTFIYGTRKQRDMLQDQSDSNIPPKPENPSETPSLTES